MRVDVSSILPCNAEQAWSEVRTSRLLVEVAAPLVAIRPDADQQLPDVWSVGPTIKVRSYLFGFLPIGTRSLRFERIDPATREIQTRESDILVKRWDHVISIRSVSDECCLYRDQIDIEAGFLTAGVWLFAQWFYRHRQHRWKVVAQRLQTSQLGVQLMAEQGVAS